MYQSNREIPASRVSLIQDTEQIVRDITTVYLLHTVGEFRSGRSRSRHLSADLFSLSQYYFIQLTSNQLTFLKWHRSRADLLLRIINFHILEFEGEDQGTTFPRFSWKQWVSSSIQFVYNAKISQGLFSLSNPYLVLVCLIRGMEFLQTFASRPTERYWGSPTFRRKRRIIARADENTAEKPHPKIPYIDKTTATTNNKQTKANITECECVEF